MKRLLLASLTIAAMGLAAQSFAGGGCPDCDCSPACKPNLFQRCVSLFHAKRCRGCGKACGPFHRCAGLHHHRAQVEDMGYGGGPPIGQVTYPYYTNRGPRDFLIQTPPSPPSIGP